MNEIFDEDLTWDIRKIYVCKIAKQTSVRNIKSSGPEFFYEGKIEYGLFEKTLQGYRHILSNKYYPKPSPKTGNKYVILPDSSEKLVKKEKDLCVLIIKSNNSYKVDAGDVAYIEDKLNVGDNYLEKVDYHDDDMEIT